MTLFLDNISCLWSLDKQVYKKTSVIRETQSLLFTTSMELMKPKCGSPFRFSRQNGVMAQTLAITMQIGPSSAKTFTNDYFLSHDYSGLNYWYILTIPQNLLVTDYKTTEPYELYIDLRFSQPCPWHQKSCLLEVLLWLDWDAVSPSSPVWLQRLLRYSASASPSSFIISSRSATVSPQVSAREYFRELFMDSFIEVQLCWIPCM